MNRQIPEQISGTEDLNMDSSHNKENLGQENFSNQKKLEASENENVTLGSEKTLNLVGHLLEAGQFKQALELMEKTLKRYELECPETIKTVIDLQTKMGEILFLQGKFSESKKCFDKALELQQKYLDDPNSMEIAKSFLNIGKVLTEQQYNDKTFSYFEKCLNMTRKVSLNHPLSFSCIAYTARLFRLQGKHEQSFTCLGLKNENIPSVGENAIHLAEYYREKGIAYAYKNLFAEAEKYLEKALSIQKKFHDDSVQCALIYLGFGEVYLSCRNAEKAHQNFQKALTIYERFFGIENAHYQIARCYEKIGMTFQIERDFEKGFDMMNKALKLRLQISEEIQPHIAESYYNLGCLYSECNSIDQALESFSQSLDIYLDVFGLDSIGVASSYQNIATLYSAFNDDEKAIEYFELSIKIRAACQEETSMDTARCYHNVGQILTKQGKVMVSIENFKKAVNIYKKFGNNPDLGLCYLNIGTLCEDAGIYSEDLENYQNALDVFVKCLGKMHPLLAETYNRVGALKFWRGEYPEAVENYKKSIKIASTIYGPDHHALASYYNNLAMAHCRLKNAKAGFSAIKKCLRVLEKNNKVPYKDMSQIYQTMGSLFEEKRFYSSAVDCFKKSSVIQKGLENRDPVLKELIFRLEKQNVANDYKLCSDSQI